MRRSKPPRGIENWPSSLQGFGPWPLALLFLLLALPALSQSQSPSSHTESTSSQPQVGIITGAVVDKTGAFIAGAKVTLSRDEGSTGTEVLSGADGQFSFPNVSPGPFHLIISASGFAQQASSGILETGETAILPPVMLSLAVIVSGVDVTLTKTELAEQEIKDQEQQRVLGFVPNFYVSYLPDALPLTAKQKFELTWRSSIDPVTFGLAGLIAGVQQSRNDYTEFGQGAEGYAKRYGAAYATLFTGALLSDAVFPSLFKQDPRYFYKGTGSIRSRFFYAVSRSIIGKGDNGRWQLNYSNILGNFAASGISNLFYPPKDRNGIGSISENTVFNIGGNAVGNLAQEFLLKKLTPHARKFHPNPAGSEVP